MLHLSRISLIVLTVLSSLSGALPAVAGSFTMTPIRIDFAPDRRDTSLTIQNDAPAPVSIQARAYEWHIENGEDRYTLTKDILIAPPIMTIAPNALQVVRAAFRNSADPRKEISYRIFFAELPQARESTKTQVDMTLTVGIPVFMAPAVHSETDPPTWSAQIRRQSDGTSSLYLSVENRGNVHFRIDRLNVRALGKDDGADSKTARILLSPDMSSYVLAGARRHWNVSLSPDVAEQFRTVELRYAIGDKESVVPVPVVR